MISIFIRFFFILTSSIYSYNKILNIQPVRKKYCIINTVFSLITAIIIPLIWTQSVTHKIALIFISFLIYVSVYTNTVLSISFTVAIISFAISYILLSLSSIVLGAIAAPLFANLTTLLSPVFILITGLLQYILTYLLFKIKRLRNGMPFLLKNRFSISGILLCVSIISFFALLPNLSSASFSIHFLTLVIALMFTLVFIYWWRRKITQSYIEKLRMGELESLYKDLADKDREIDKLNNNNTYLAKIIHKDNKLIPAMELAVRNYLQNAATMGPEKAKEYGADLLLQLQGMTAEREGILQSYHENSATHPQIGIYSVDAVILYMEKRALEHGIRFDSKFDKGLKVVMLSYIKENDVLHLLSDLVENAIIATMHENRKDILLHIGFFQNNLFIDIYDTGLPFRIETYQDFGNRRHTTHADTGGSGIGLMDIWKITRKYKASLQIYEYLPDSNTYTKKIRVMFDRRNHFLIQTYRYKEIKAQTTRSDLYIFGHDIDKLPEISEEKNSKLN